MSRKFETVCPNCGHKNDVVTESLYMQKAIVTCDVDAGGCDEDYVAVIYLLPSVHTYKLEEAEYDNPKN